MNRNPDHMNTEEVVAEITSLQDETNARAFRLHELADSLSRRTRRAPVDDNTAIYITYANAITRFAGAVAQVSARTVRAAKVLNRLAPKRTESPKAEKVARSTPKASPSPMESLISSYVGEPLVNLETPKSDDNA